MKAAFADIMNRRHEREIELLKEEIASIQNSCVLFENYLLYIINVQDRTEGADSSVRSLPLNTVASRGRGGP